MLLRDRQGTLYELRYSWVHMKMRPFRYMSSPVFWNIRWVRVPRRFERTYNFDLILRYTAEKTSKLMSVPSFTQQTVLWTYRYTTK